MNFSPGTYKTRNGATAILKKIVSANAIWYLRGALCHPYTNIYLLGYWTLAGVCATDGSGTGQFDLVVE